MKMLSNLVKPLAVAGFSVAMMGAASAQTYDNRPQPPQPREQYTEQRDYDRDTRSNYYDRDRGYGYERLRGRRFETMRRLAAILDEQAQQAARQAARDAARGDWRERRMLRRVSEFAQQASQFHVRVDRYLASPWDIRADVVSLDETARWVNERVRTARVYSRSFSEWDQTLDVLERMKTVISGRDVEVPRYGPRFRVTFGN